MRCVNLYYLKLANNEVLEVNATFNDIARSLFQYDEFDKITYFKIGYMCNHSENSTRTICSNMFKQHLLFLPNYIKTAKDFVVYIYLSKKWCNVDDFLVSNNISIGKRYYLFLRYILLNKESFLNKSNLQISKQIAETYCMEESAVFSNLYNKVNVNDILERWLNK